ncbi:MAG: DUF202 domain-containing protein [Bacteroidales bacterium]|nr:DUF202 domain-containing protein [Bacteroidales bacterium]
MNEKHILTVSEKLAIDRTKLANERTFLAFFRSFVVMLSSGLAIIKLQALKNIYILGIILMIIALLLFSYGIFHYFKVKKRILSYM